MPGNVCRSSAEARFRFTGPFWLKPSRTPWATAFALRAAAAVTVALALRTASGLRLAGEQPMARSKLESERSVRRMVVRC